VSQFYTSQLLFQVGYTSPTLVNLEDDFAAFFDVTEEYFGHPKTGHEGPEGE
jgi:hypothetical protein